MSASNYLVDAISEGHSDDIWCLKYSTAGVITGSADGTLKLWDPRNTDEAKCSMQPTVADRKGKRAMPIVGLDVQQNATPSSFAISTTLDSVVTRWSLRDDAPGHEEASWSLPPPTLAKQPGQAWAVSVHPNPATEVFATSGLSGLTRVLSSSVNSFGQERQIIASKSQFATCIYSPNGKVLATATNDGNVYLYDSETGQMLTYWIAHTGNVRSIVFSPDSSLVITGGDDRQLNVFDVRGLTSTQNDKFQHGNAHSFRSRQTTAQQVANLQGHTGWVLSLACRSDGRVFSSSSSDGTIRLWDLTRPASACLSILREHESDVWAVDWAEMPQSPHAIEGIGGSGFGGGRFASGGKDGKLRWWRGTG